MIQRTRVYQEFIQLGDAHINTPPQDYEPQLLKDLLNEKPFIPDVSHVQKKPNLWQLLSVKFLHNVYLKINLNWGKE